MKLISWNVNGLRAVLKRNFMDFLKEADADVVCLQEIKAEPEQVEADWPSDLHLFWNPAKRKGYSGTLALAREEPLNVTYGIGEEEGDSEGRVISLEYLDFFLVTVYTPNAKGNLARLGYRHKTWDVKFLQYVKGLEKSKPVVFCGDLNVAHKEIDLANPKANRGKAGFTDEEREGFDNIIASGFIDTFREFEQGEGHYSWWSYRTNARARNGGWRIDYFCISPALRPRRKDAFISSEVTGSDHCPVGVVLG